MGFFPPLRDTLADAARGVARSALRVWRGDVRSANWDGGGDLSSGKDTTATKGMFWDYSSGSLQISGNLYAPGADIENINADKITVGTLVVGRIADGSLDTVKIKDSAITEAKVALNAITNGKLAALSVSTAKIQALAITNAKINDLNAGKISVGTLNADRIAAGSLDADKITAGTITTDRLVIGSFDNLISNPGFESGSTVPHYTGDAPGSSWELKGNATDGNPPRSGAYQMEVRHDTLSGTAHLHLNGNLATASGHFEVHEGDEIYAECYVRGEGTQITQGLIELRWLKADGTSAGGEVLGGAKAITIHATNHIKLVVAGAAPANAMRAVVRVAVNATSGAPSYVAVDDLYCRRMIGTLIIEGQAVDIARMLNPVDAQSGTATAVVVLNTGTAVIEVSDTITVPSFVGSLSVFSGGWLYSEWAASQNVFVVINIGGSQHSGFTEYVTSGATGLQALVTVSERTITSPGSTVIVALKGSVTTSQETDVDAQISWSSTGIR